MPDLSIVIPTRNKPARLRITLAALSRATAGAETEVVVVADGCTVEVPAGARAIHMPGHAGRATARNVGARATQGTRLLFLDDDIVLDRAVLGHHLQAPERTVVSHGILGLPWIRMVEDPLAPSDRLGPALSARIAALGTFTYRELAPHGRASAFEAHLRRSLEAPGSDRWLGCTGGCLSVSRALFDRLDGFDPTFGRRWGMEDLEFGLRAERAGAWIDRPSDPPAIHLDHPTADRPDGQDENLALFGRLHGRDLEERARRFFDAAGAAA